MVEISIIIPTHDNPDTLPKTLKSIRRQSFQDYEIIIVNDGGQSPSEFLDLGDSRIRLIDLPENAGVAHARNVEFGEATGDILYFLDADDLIAEDLLGFASARMRETDCGMFAVLHTPVPVVEVSDREDLLKSADRSSGFRDMDSAEFCEAFRKDTQDFLPSTVLFRRSAMVEAAGEAPWETSLKNGADTLIILLVGARRRVLQSLDRFVLYSVRSNSLSRQNELATWSNRIAAMDIFLERMQAEDADKRVVRTGRRLRQNAARRVARIHKANGRRLQGARVLLADILEHPNGKSVLELVRVGVLPR